MTEENTTPDEPVTSADAFPTLALIAEQFVTEDGVDTEGLTTEQLLQAAREAFFMHHSALQELAASMQTLGMFLGALDDRVEQTIVAAEGGQEVPAEKPENPTPSPIILPTLKKS